METSDTNHWSDEKAHTTGIPNNLILLPSIFLELDAAFHRTWVQNDKSNKYTFFLLSKLFGDIKDTYIGRFSNTFIPYTEGKLLFIYSIYLLFTTCKGSESSIIAVFMTHLYIYTTLFEEYSFTHLFIHLFIFRLFTYFFIASFINFFVS